ncbi:MULTISPECIES: DMT family transporter [Bacillaceae]|uniref:DMT family transporter n=1 Tax=Metabacillus sediminis TaxID=3117746 RepID=A0ABZ2NI07_9BACI|nr:DMT family transporter [Bacillus sp. SJS]KZZ83479.1 hypothetical protein AS29_015870 [Bacillus sp. SJS]
MKGIIFSIMGGIFITLQGVFNSRMSEDLGVWRTNALIHLIGFTLSIVVYSFIRDGRVSGLKEVPPFYLIGGLFGGLIVFGEMSAINELGVAFAVSVLLIAQLLCAFIIDSKGLFGAVKERVKKRHWIGIGIMILGVFIFKM